VSEILAKLSVFCMEKIEKQVTDSIRLIYVPRKVLWSRYPNRAVTKNTQTEQSHILRFSHKYLKCSVK